MLLPFCPSFKVWYLTDVEGHVGKIIARKINGSKTKLLILISGGFGCWLWNWNTFYVCCQSRCEDSDWSWPIWNHLSGHGHHKVGKVLEKVWKYHCKKLIKYQTKLMIRYHFVGFILKSFFILRMNTGFDAQSCLLF